MIVSSIFDTEVSSIRTVYGHQDDFTGHRSTKLSSTGKLSADLPLISVSIDFTDKCTSGALSHLIKSSTHFDRKHPELTVNETRHITI